MLNLCCLAADTVTAVADPLRFPPPGPPPPPPLPFPVWPCCNKRPCLWTALAQLPPPLYLEWMMVDMGILVLWEREARWIPPWPPPGATVSVGLPALVEQV